LGRITKTHGYNGALVLVSERHFHDDLEDCLDELFVVIDGLQVPFPVKELTLLTDTSARVRLEFVDNRDEALKLTGCELYAAVDFSKPEPEMGLEQWKGFSVHDSKYGKIGVVQEIEDYNGNMIMQVMGGDREILISLFPELVTRIDADSNILYINAPDGCFS
jgi:ribosomal 30S subunit maturation factor RimM